MQPTVNANTTLQAMIQRQNEMQYEAMANALSGQPLNDDFLAEYAALEKSLAKETTLSTSERSESELNKMQYAAMANALAGQPQPEEI